MHLVGFTIEIYYDARPYERQNWREYLNIPLVPRSKHVLSRLKVKLPCQ